MNAHDATLALLPMWLTEMPPAGITALSTYLRRRGYRVRVLDLNVECYRRASPEKRRLWDRENFFLWSDPVRFREIAPALADEIEYAARRLLEAPAPLLAFSVVHPNRNFTKAVLARVRAADPDRILVLGGRGWEREPDRRIFKDGIPDVLVEGEGEETLADLLDAVRTGRPLAEVAGLLFWDGGAYRASGIRPLLADLDALPLPTYEEFDLSLYTTDQLPLTLSRGCVCRCAYCNDQPMSGRFRFRSGARVAQEVAELVRRLGASRFQFTDSAVNGNLRALLDFARIVARAGLEIAWEGSALPRRDMTRAHLDLLARSGCRSLTFGIESGADRVLAAMGRRWTAAEQARVVRDTFEAGIETRINLIVGFPGETEEDFDGTLRWVEENRRWISGISNLNSCQVLFPARLSLDPDQYGVVPAADIHLSEEHWTDVRGLDREARSRRLERLGRLVESLGLAYWTSNERRREMTPEEIAGLARRDIARRGPSDV